MYCIRCCMEMMHLKVYSGSFPFSSNPVPPRAAEPEFIDTSGTSDTPLCTSADNPGKDWIKLYQINFVNRSGMVPNIDDEVKL